jgi:ribonuclease M5
MMEMMREYIMDKMKINEVIVVEGRDDTAAVHRAVDAETIETHGFGLSDEMWKRIESAYKKKGIIVFTDPDSAGERIRKKVTERFPDAGQAFLPRSQAMKKDNIGVENAKPEDIREALSKAHCTVCERSEQSAPAISWEDMLENGLCGGSGSRARRQALGDLLGIGYGNARAMLKKLNGFNIDREEFYGALQSINDQTVKK